MEPFLKTDKTIAQSPLIPVPVLKYPYPHKTDIASALNFSSRRQNLRIVFL